MLNTGFFFVPAAVGDFPGFGFFQPAAEDDRCLGHIAVRKKVADSSGNPVRTELGGFSFQLFDANNSPVGDAFTTDSAGHALSPAVAVGPTYTLRETQVRSGFQPAQDIQIALDTRRKLQIVTNTAPNTNPGYH